MAAPAFTNMLNVLYARLGDAAIFEAKDGSAPRQVQVKFDLVGGEGLDGSHLINEPRVRVSALDFPQGIQRDDAFTINGRVYRAAHGGTALNDGNELEAALRLVTP